MRKKIIFPFAPVAGINNDQSLRELERNERRKNVENLVLQFEQNMADNSANETFLEQYEPSELDLENIYDHLTQSEA